MHEWSLKEVHCAILWKDQSYKALEEASAPWDEQANKDLEEKDKAPTNVKKIL